MRCTLPHEHRIALFLVWSSCAGSKRRLEVAARVLPLICGCFHYAIGHDASIVPPSGTTVPTSVPSSEAPAASLLFETSVTLMATLLDFSPSLAAVLHEKGVFPQLVRSFAAATSIAADLFDTVAKHWTVKLSQLSLPMGTTPDSGVQVWASLHSCGLSCKCF